MRTSWLLNRALWKEDGSLPVGLRIMSMLQPEEILVLSCQLSHWMTDATSSSTIWKQLLLQYYLSTPFASIMSNNASVSAWKTVFYISALSRSIWRNEVSMIRQLSNQVTPSGAHEIKPIRTLSGRQLLVVSNYRRYLLTIPMNATRRDKSQGMVYLRERLRNVQISRSSTRNRRVSDIGDASSRAMSKVWSARRRLSEMYGMRSTDSMVYHATSDLSGSMMSLTDSSLVIEGHGVSSHLCSVEINNIHEVRIGGQAHTFRVKSLYDDLKITMSSKEGAKAWVFAIRALGDQWQSTPCTPNEIPSMRSLFVGNDVKQLSDTAKPSSRLNTSTITSWVGNKLLGKTDDQACLEARLLSTSEDEHIDTKVEAWKSFTGFCKKLSSELYEDPAEVEVVPVHLVDNQEGPRLSF